MIVLPVFQKTYRIACALLLASLHSALGQSVNVLTQHNDLSRSGANPNETILTTANINSSSFRRGFRSPILACLAGNSGAERCHQHRQHTGGSRGDLNARDRRRRRNDLCGCENLRERCADLSASCPGSDYRRGEVRRSGFDRRVELGDRRHEFRRRDSVCRSSGEPASSPHAGERRGLPRVRLA